MAGNVMKQRKGMVGGSKKPKTSSMSYKKMPKSKSKGTKY